MGRFKGIISKTNENETMKGEIIDIATMIDEYGNKEFRVTITIESTPKLFLGKCEIIQEGMKNGK